MRSFHHSTGVPSAGVLPRWTELLHRAVTEPGVVSTAFSRFHSYSVRNQLLALFQCRERGLQPGPLATYGRWKELGRYVRKAEKTLTLCMPATRAGIQLCFLRSLLFRSPKKLHTLRLGFARCEGHPTPSTSTLRCRFAV